MQMRYSTICYIINRDSKDVGMDIQNEKGKYNLVQEVYIDCSAEQ